jgi:hypothetical protein
VIRILLRSIIVVINVLQDVFIEALKLLGEAEQGAINLLNELES